MNYFIKYQDCIANTADISSIKKGSKEIFLNLKDRENPYDICIFSAEKSILAIVFDEIISFLKYPPAFGGLLDVNHILNRNWDIKDKQLSEESEEALSPFSP